MFRRFISRMFRPDPPAQAAEPRRALPPSPLMECWAEYRDTFTEECIATDKRRAVKPIRAERSAMVHAALRGVR